MKIWPIYQIKNKLNNIVSKGKDKLENENHHDVVLKIKCAECDMNYIGQTKRAFKTRIKEHKNNINLSDKSKHSVVTLQRINNDHDMN